MSSPAGDLGVLVAALLAGTALAELLGATNMGTALTFGTLAFTAALLWALLRPPHDAAPRASRGARQPQSRT